MKTLYWCGLYVYRVILPFNFNCCNMYGQSSNHIAYDVHKIHQNAIRVTLNEYRSPYSDTLELESTYATRSGIAFRKVKKMRPA